MVKLLCVLMVLFINVSPAASLKLELSDHHVEMGKYLTATFRYEGDQKPELIDLDLWQDDFYIEQSDADLEATATNTIISTTKVKLYPRHTGDLTLDAIALGGSFVKPKHINASPSIRNNIDATPIINPLKNDYWADETIIISIRVPLHYARNEVIAKEWLINGFTIIPLRSIKKDNSVELQWMVFTPFKGLYQLELPTIVQRGRGRFKFHLPQLNFTVKPLPAYLPSSVASGAIEVSSKIMLKGEKKIVRITLQKTGYLPKNIEGLQYFINTLSDNELSHNLQTDEHSDNGITTRNISITLPEWLWGKVLILKIPYFNTQTGRLDSLEHPLPKVYTLPKYAQYFIITLSILTFFFILSIIFNITKKRRQLRDFKQGILQASSAKEIRLILLNKGQFKTLGEWAHQTPSIDMLKMSDFLNQACYQLNTSTELSHLKEYLTTKLKFNLKDF